MVSSALPTTVATRSLDAPFVKIAELEEQHYEEVYRGSVLEVPKSGTEGTFAKLASTKDGHLAPHPRPCSLRHFTASFQPHSQTVMTPGVPVGLWFRESSSCVCSIQARSRRRMSGGSGGAGTGTG